MNFVLFFLHLCCSFIIMVSMVSSAAPFLGLLQAQQPLDTARENSNYHQSRNWHLQSRGPRGDRQKNLSRKGLCCRVGSTPPNYHETRQTAIRLGHQAAGRVARAWLTSSGCKSHNSIVCCCAKCSPVQKQVNMIHIVLGWDIKSQNNSSKIKFSHYLFAPHAHRKILFSWTTEDT